MLVDLFARIENFFERLESYMEVPPTDAMTGKIVNIMIEVLSILGIATKEIKQTRSSELIVLHHHSLLTFFRKICEEVIGKE